MEHIKTDKILSLAWKTAYMLSTDLLNLYMHIGGFPLFL